jgi:hypothetical protein
LHEDANVKNLNSETATEGAVKERLKKEATQQASAGAAETPLFLRYSSEGQKGDPQDEKDKSAE